MKNHQFALIFAKTKNISVTIRDIDIFSFSWGPKDKMFQEQLKCQSYLAVDPFGRESPKVDPEESELEPPGGKVGPRDQLKPRTGPIGSIRWRRGPSESRTGPTEWNLPWEQEQLGLGRLPGSAWC